MSEKFEPAHEIMVLNTQATSEGSCYNLEIIPSFQ